ncbi:MAG TPA: DEAD/DEAH box helicase [Dehalococcoidia bacterium]|nr:DEAD/DEAH box helicase [Dehalococcoidia bacterium]
MLDSLSITEPTAIQAQAIPVMLEGRDIIGQAHTGSGKTLAFGLPLIECTDPGYNVTQALILTPTRELAQQVGGVLEQLGRPAGIAVLTIYGGVGYGPQMDALKKGPQVVVGTPGRILDHLQRGTLRLDHLGLLVLDEADQMLDKGFAPDVERIIRQTPKERQTALFSATTPDWVREVSARHLREPEYIHIGVEEEAAPDIEHSIIEVWSGEKLPVLLSLLSQPTEGATLVFGRTRHGVINLARRLQKLGFDVEALQGDLGQPARDRIVKRFREGALPILLATNVAARGLDMLNIERVINYDLPETSELFVHRVGRTGRMGRSGQAITLIAATDLLKIQEIERDLGRKLPRIPVPPPVYSAPVQAKIPQRPVITQELPATPAAETGETGKPRRRRRSRRGRSWPEGQLAPAAT